MNAREAKLTLYIQRIDDGNESLKAIPALNWLSHVRRHTQALFPNMATRLLVGPPGDENTLVLRKGEVWDLRGKQLAYWELRAGGVATLESTMG